jgi:SAM-dependent methyltransferase
MSKLKTLFRYYAENRKPIDDGAEGVQAIGHRAFVGGRWEAIGAHQFEFLKAQGLRPEHVFLDIACGAFRAGVHLIPYLDAGNYLGIEKEAELVAVGLAEEVGDELRAAKRPEVVVSDAFEFERLSKAPDFAIAQSLFTHLAPKDIERCMANLSAVVEPGALFFATYGETPVRLPQVYRSHARRNFLYTRRQMASFGTRNGWTPTRIGDWGHPSGQLMMRYEAR